MTRWPCTYCVEPEPADTRDHLGGRRDGSRVPLRAVLWVPAHRRCNAAAFTPWRIAGLAQINGRGPLVIEARRTIVSLRRIVPVRPSVTLPAETIAGLVELLDDLTTRVEEAGS